MAREQLPAGKRFWERPLPFHGVDLVYLLLGGLFVTSVFAASRFDRPIDGQMISTGMLAVACVLGLVLRLGWILASLMLCIVAFEAPPAVDSPPESSKIVLLILWAVAALVLHRVNALLSPQPITDVNEGSTKSQ